MRRHVISPSENRLGSRRRGMSLLMTMVTISTALVLTMTFMRTQTVQLQIAENGENQDYALQAAQSGASIALQKMSSPDWKGVGSNITGVFHEDSTGVAKYVVTFSKYVPDSTDDSTTAFTNADTSKSSGLEYHPSLYVKVTSQGIWQANDDSTASTRTVEVGAHLKLRTKTTAEGKSVIAEDLANPYGYDYVQQFSLFAHDTSESLTLDPGGRIEGNVYVGDEIDFFDDPDWSSSVRATLLDSIGKDYVTDNGKYRYQHPLAGSVTSRYGVRSETAEDCKLMQVPLNRTDFSPAYPEDFNLENIGTYQIYKGGPEYSPVKIDGYLSGKYLRPTASNPLGIFYSPSGLKISSNVTVVGTLLVNGDLKIYGTEVYLSSYNWRGTHGEKLTPGDAEWPRLPAIVADKLYIDRDVRVVIEGAVNLDEGFIGGGAYFDLTDARAINWETKATATPYQQPYSFVQLYDTSLDLTLLQNSGHYEVYLEQDGPAGVSAGWHRIVSVDSRARRLLIVGEVNAPNGTIAKIRPSRTRYIEMRGPLAGKKHEMHRNMDWDLSSGLWWDLRYYWEKYNEHYRYYGIPEQSFTEFIADPHIFSRLGGRWAKYGLPLEATFNLRRPHNVRFRWKPPLFGPAPAKTASSSVFYATPATGDEQIDESGGYRWGVIFWREAAADTSLESPGEEPTPSRTETARRYGHYRY